jgi:hypothetical protein
MFLIKTLKSESLKFPVKGNKWKDTVANVAKQPGFNYIMKRYKQ